MKCPFCAEEIQDAAILCRFCGARRPAGGTWVAPGGSASSTSAAPFQAPPARRKGAFTIKSSGVLFVLSGVVSLISVKSDVPLFGAMRGGLIALGYNFLFVAVFLGMGFGLIQGRVWGYRMVFIGTAVYSLDRLMMLLDKSTREAYLNVGGLLQQAGGLIDLSMLDEAVVLTILVSLACWWGFAFYIFRHRSYFQPT